MTQPTKAKLIAWIVAVGTIVPSLAWGWSVVDNRYVRRDEYVVHNILDSINNVTTQHKLDGHDEKLDEILTRLTQIECGKKVVSGCR